MTNHDSEADVRDESRVFRTRFGTDETAAEAVLRAVSSLSGTPSVDFDTRLYDCLDPDAMNALVDADADESDLEISFVFLEYHVTVGTDRTVTIRDASSTDAGP